MRRWIWDGKLPARKIGNQLFIRQTDLDQVTGKDPEAVKAAQLAALEALRQLGERIRARRGSPGPGRRSGAGEG